MQDGLYIGTPVACAQPLFLNFDSSSTTENIFVNAQSGTRGSDIPPCRI